MTTMQNPYAHLVAFEQLDHQAAAAAAAAAAYQQPNQTAVSYQHHYNESIQPPATNVHYAPHQPIHNHHHQQQQQNQELTTFISTGVNHQHLSSATHHQIQQHQQQQNNYHQSSYEVGLHNTYSSAQQHTLLSSSSPPPSQTHLDSPSPGALDSDCITGSQLDEQLMNNQSGGLEATKSTKGASKMRRDLINTEIAQLRDLLPLPASTRQRLSQLQLMALVLVYVRKTNYFYNGSNLFRKSFS